MKKSQASGKTIPPTQHLRGEQLAGWIPKKQSPPLYPVLCFANIAVDLPDGTRLRGDLYRPQAEGTFPALVAWSSYTRAFQQTGLPLPINEAGIVSYIVSRGYCHLTVNARGTGGSEGTHELHFSPSEQRDVADTIEWVAAQSWCDGQVGMVGMSYFAAIQYLAAAQHPPHLKAIFPYLGFTDLYRHFASHGGAFHAGLFAPYSAFVGATQKVSLPPLMRHLLSYVLDRKWVQKKITRFFFTHEEKLPQQLRPEESWMRHFATFAFDEPYDGPFYWEKSAWPLLDRIQIPVCIGTNWGNPGLHLRGAFEAWQGIHAPKKLFIGPPDPRWPWSNYHEELLAWYDYYLKGIETGVADVPAVRYWLQGADCWKEASDWPIPGTHKRCFYLAEAEEKTDEAHRLHTHPPQQETTWSFVALPHGMQYPKELEKYEAQWLTFLTDPWEEETEMVGPMHLHLTLASTALDTHILARLSDIAPTQKVRLLSFGWLQASHRKQDMHRSRPDEIIHEHRTPEALTPGTPVSLDISLTPTANLFKRGHRLRLEIGSRPDLLKATVFDGFIFFPYEAPPYPARNTIFSGGNDPSFLEVEVRPTERTCR